MSYQSSESLTFLSTVQQWIGETGEVLVMIRFSHAGGSRSFEFFSGFGTFLNRVRQCPPSTCLLVFRKPQLPLRGVIDDAFVASATKMVPDGEEYLIAGLKEIHYGKASWLENWSGDTLRDVMEDLEYAKGTQVAFGPFPPWLHDSEDLISAVVPQSDGSVVTGVY